MKASWIIGLVVFAGLLAPSARAVDVPSCTKEQLLGFSPNRDEVKAHRQFPAPVISYPFGAKMDEWGFKFTVRIDESGGVVCASATDQFTENPLILNDQRRRSDGRHVLHGVGFRG